MATGSGTGTPATAVSSATLNTIRDRIRTLIENASGLTEPLHVIASTLTLANYRDRVEEELNDSGNAKWSTDQIDEYLIAALEHTSKFQPNEKIGTVVLGADGREISIASLTDCSLVKKVWWDYDSTDPAFPPNYRQFEIWPGQILYIDDREEPQTGDTVRIWYTAEHTINTLNSATATTVPKGAETAIVTGAAYYALLSRATLLTEQATVDRTVVERIQEQADNYRKIFHRLIRGDLPLYIQRKTAFAQGDIDEAVRWAVARFGEIAPPIYIAALTLTSTGREIDISTLFYTNIIKVWARYDAASPEYQPSWTNFEVWPSNILYINDPIEPVTGDVYRVWYTYIHTINGLDGAAVTTLSAQDIETIIVGASGYATQERILEKTSFSGNRVLRDWGEIRIKEFEKALTRASRREATISSGIASSYTLDRWDEEWS